MVRPTRTLAPARRRSAASLCGTVVIDQERG
jgi:hypothetical protein